jgi:hypothetical protein
MSKSSILANRQNTQEIPSDRWIPFLAEFTKEYRGAHARLEIVGVDSEIGYQVQTENRPFDGISADIKDRERAIWIAFAAPAGENLTHGIHDAAAIRMLPPTGDTGPVLEVESPDGTKSILELTTPEPYALPQE